MKKLVSVLLLLVLVISLASCGETPDPSKKSDGVMTYAEYKAAAIDTEVTIEAYVQDTQSWWDNKITVYAADPDGAYFIYELACSEEDAAKLTAGTKIKVTGVKGEWAGEIEIMEATFEFGDDITWTAEPKDLTALLSKAELIDHQNELALFKGLTVESVSYKGGERGDDVYLTVSRDGASYDFCVERYLTDPDTDVYKAVEALKAGDVVDITAYLYWYNGANPHIVGVTSTGKNLNNKSEGVMTYAEYAAAAVDSDVVIEAYVQATQSWWDNKITVYAADVDGAYFIYELSCSEADAAKLTPGTKIKVSGVKGEWAGEVEIMEAAFEFAGDDKYIAPAADLTSALGKAELIDSQNQLALFKGLTVVSVTYKGGERGDDVYLTVSRDGASYDFCVERYLTDPDTDVYKAVEALKAGDVVDITAYLYWYNGANPHIVGVVKK